MVQNRNALISQSVYNAREKKEDADTTNINIILSK